MKNLAIIACVLMVLAPHSGSGYAQDRNSVFLLPERTLLQHLTRAKRAIADERYSDAVIELGALLNSPYLSRSGQGGETQDYFVGPFGTAGTRRSIKGEAQRLLGSMPRQGRELYELQYGADARALLDRAVREQSMEDLNEVIRRYFHTGAGYEAMVLLGRLQLDRGRPLAAALCFKRVLESPAAKPLYEPQLSVLLGACWVYSDMPDQALDTMALLKKRFPTVKVELGEGSHEMLPESDEALAWLKQHFGPIPRRGQIDAAQWLVHRGNLQRNATCAGGMPLTQFRWQTPTTTDPFDERLVDELQKSFSQQGLPAIPSVSPLAVDDVVLMRTPERLLAVNFKTGKRIWEYPWWNSSFQSAVQGHQSGSRTVEISTRKLQLRERLWHDATYGLISSDGDSVFLVDDLRFAPTNFSRSPALQGRPFRQVYSNLPKSYNQLVSLDVKREGSLRWKVGGENGEDEPKLAGAFFMGPPLPLLGQLYVIVEVRHELRLVVLDAETGRQEWTQQIAHVEASIARNRQRRLAGATPSFGNGVLICPTSVGAVVALDVTTRSLLWGYEYSLSTVKAVGFGGTSFGSSLAAPGEVWTDATATIADGSVLLTPIESNLICCLDLLTGVPKWTPKKREGELADMQYIACVHQGNAILVGKHKLVALSMSDGEQVWSCPLRRSEGEMPSGRGFQTGDSYFLPTTTSELLEVDLKSGKIVERVKSPRVLGNLVCYNDQVISQGVDKVAAFYQIEPLRRLVAERLAKSADDAWALGRQGELLVHDGKKAEALIVLRQAFELAPRDETVRTLMVSLFLELLRKDFASHVAVAPKMEPRIQLPHHRLEFLRLMAAGMEQSGDVAGAAEKYLQLALLQIENFDPYAASESPTVIAEKGRTVRLDRWVQSRLAHVYKESDQVGQAKMRASLRNDNATEAELRQFIKYFGFLPSADQAREQLARTLAVSDRALEADLLLARLEKNVSREKTGTVVAEIAAKLLEVDETDLAAHYYQRLANNWADVDCGDGKTGGQLFAEATKQDALRRRLFDISQWPVGQTTWTSSQNRRTRQLNVFVPLVEQQRPAGQQFSIVYDSGASSIVLRDGRGQEWLRLPLADGNSYLQQPPGTYYAKVFGQLLYVVLGDQSVALDLSRGPQNEAAILWRANLALPSADIGRVRANARELKNINPLDRNAPSTHTMFDAAGKPIGSAGPVTDAGITYQKSTALICADPISGEALWKREGLEPGCALFGDAQLTFAVPPNSTTAEVIDSRTGRILGKRAVPDWQHRWAIHGRFVLAWEKQPTKNPSGDAQAEAQLSDVRLFLYDAWREEDVWSQTFSDGARGTLVKDDQVAILEPDGRFLIRSLHNADVVLSQKIEPETNLTAIYVLPSTDRYLLVTDTDNQPVGKSAYSIQELGGKLPAPLIFGHVHAFSRDSGEPLWQTPATIENYSLPLVQPNECPTLWFLRRGASANSNNAPIPSDQISVLCIDRRDGRELLTVKDVSAAKPLSYNVRVDFENSMVTMVVGGTGFAVEFTDEPAAPEPTAQTGSAASVIDDTGGLWNVGGAVMKAIIGDAAAN
jgi:outer membrane protein assembly factor BamB/tetratricopeptide (TPR) repeat protein